MTIALDERYSCKLLLPAQVEEEWPVLRQLLAHGVQHNFGEFVVDDILQMVFDRRMFVMVLKRESEIVLALVGEISSYPQRKIMNIVCLAGTGLGVLITQFHEEFRSICRMFKVDAIRWNCRPAVARLLKRYIPECRPIYLVVQREVTYEDLH